MDFQEQYQALLTSDPAYEGRFLVGVKTTGIFCRPTCRARKPKAENVEFYARAEEALSAGYRPCKLCHPLQNAQPVPLIMQSLLHEVESHPDRRVTDEHLRLRGLDPGTVRRWFRKHHGLTFQAYQRSRRLKEAFGRLRQGEPLAQTALDAGFDSLSGFGDSFKKAFGASPTKLQAQSLLMVTRVSTPLGVMVAGAVDQGLCLLEFADDPDLESELALLERQLHARVLSGEHGLLQALAVQLKEYFEQTRRVFDLPLVQPGTEFQQKAWQALTTIPYGQTSTYRSQAAQIGHPSAVRAIGSANGRNRLAVVVPCHRVVGVGAKLAGYRGGLWRKQWLLDWEAGRIAPTGALP